MSSGDNHQGLVQLLRECGFTGPMPPGTLPMNHPMIQELAKCLSKENFFSSQEQEELNILLADNLTLDEDFNDLKQFVDQTGKIDEASIKKEIDDISQGRSKEEIRQEVNNLQEVLSRLKNQCEDLKHLVCENEEALQRAAEQERLTAGATAHMYRRKDEFHAAAVSSTQGLSASLAALNRVLTDTRALTDPITSESWMHMAQPAPVLMAAENQLGEVLQRWREALLRMPSSGADNERQDEASTSSSLNRDEQRMNDSIARLEDAMKLAWEQWADAESRLAAAQAQLRVLDEVERGLAVGQQPRPLEQRQLADLADEAAKLASIRRDLVQREVPELARRAAELNSAEVKQAMNVARMAHEEWYNTELSSIMTTIVEQAGRLLVLSMLRADERNRVQLVLEQVHGVHQMLTRYKEASEARSAGYDGTGSTEARYTIAKDDEPLLNLHRMLSSGTAGLPPSTSLLPMLPFGGMLPPGRGAPALAHVKVSDLVSSLKRTADGASASQRELDQLIRGPLTEGLALLESLEDSLQRVTFRDKPAGFVSNPGTAFLMDPRLDLVQKEALSRQKAASHSLKVLSSEFNEFQDRLEADQASSLEREVLAIFHSEPQKLVDYAGNLEKRLSSFSAQTMV